MKIKNIENKLDEISDVNYRAIIQFIIEAAMDYPLYNLDTIDDYFAELEKKFNGKDISLQTLEAELEYSYKDNSETAIWVQTSLSTLIEAFVLMKVHQIDFKTILDQIKSIEE